jgi:hypothetical protein
MRTFIVTASGALRFMRCASLLVCFALSILPASAQAGLPHLAVPVAASGAPGDLAANLATAGSCAAPGSPVILPAATLDLGAQPAAVSPLAGQASALGNLPANAEVWLHLRAGFASLTGNESEQDLSARVDAALNQAPLAAHGVHGLIVEVDDPGKSGDLAAYALLRLAIGARSLNPNLRLAFAFPAGFVTGHQDLVKRLAPYSDLLGVAFSPQWRDEARWIAGQALNKPLLLKVDASAHPENALLGAALEASGTQVETLWSDAGEPSLTARICRLAGFLAQNVPASMLRIEGSAVPLSLTVDGAPTAALWLSSGQSADFVVLAPLGGDATHPRAATLQWTGKAQYDAQWFDAETGAALSPGKPLPSGDATTQSASALAAPYLLIALHRKNPEETAVYNQVEVKSGISLQVEEIVARWQQYRQAQDRRLENYEATVFMSLHFETVSIGSGFDISMNMRQFSGRNQPLEFGQTDFYVNGVHFGNKHEFPLPQLEPEKVLTQPLELKLNERYTYKLLGTEQIGGALCYVVGVEPKVAGENLYSGKIWIDGVSFREVRQTLSEISNQSNVVVNVETENFTLVNDGNGGQFNLPQSLTAQQTLNVAGRDFHLQRNATFSGFAINSQSFAADLAAERNSSDPMFQDTDQGLRSLKKVGGQRVLQPDVNKRIRSMVGGAMYAGTFNFPIPFAGISYADFDWRHTGAQMSIFFAGPIAAINYSRQQGTRFRYGTDLAVSALPGENRVYVGSVEQTGEEVWNWQETIGQRATWVASDHISLTAYAYLEGDIYRGTSDTASTYLLPRSGAALLPGVQARFTGKGYIFTADGTRGQRIAWTAFGPATPSAKLPATAPYLPESGYTLYDGDLNKDYYIRKFTKGGWDLAYFGGDQLDRFSRYFPSFFSAPRIHGIPGGTDSFDAIAMSSAHFGFNVMDMIKIEGLYSYARARDLAESSHFKKFDGAETNFNVAGPLGTLVQGTVGYAIDGNIARYNSRWSFDVMLYKPF